LLQNYAEKDPVISSNVVRLNEIESKSRERDNMGQNSLQFGLISHMHPTSEDLNKYLMHRTQEQTLNHYNMHPVIKKTSKRKK
jgi:hypothetical protein